MKQRLTILALVLVLAAAAAPSRADEGMWLLSQLPEIAPTMKAMGLQLGPNDIWDPKTGTGLASATPWLGGCSSSFVSPEGLIITNHHCAFGALQMNSTPDHDYITNGFLARSMGEELEAKGSRVTVFKGYDDVTAAIRSAIKTVKDPEARTKAIELREKELVAQCEKTGLRCRVAEMFGGAQYFLFRQLELRDVRLVCAPPRAIGEYGGEVDNWVWPRHTGDYSFLRAYVGKDGKPADYSPDNVPFKPDRYLKVAAAPLAEGDFTFILGYPGRTMRYRAASSIAEDATSYYPQRIQLLKDLIALLESESKRGKNVEIKLASQLKGYYNTFKNNEGMLEGLTRTDLAGRKRAEEAKLTVWINADPGRAAKYGDALPGLDRIIGRPRRDARTRPDPRVDDDAPLLRTARRGAHDRPLERGAREARHGARPWLPGSRRERAAPAACQHAAQPRHRNRPGDARLPPEAGRGAPSRAANCRRRRRARRHRQNRR